MGVDRHERATEVGRRQGTRGHHGCCRPLNFAAEPCDVVGFEWVDAVLSSDQMYQTVVTVIRSLRPRRRAREVGDSKLLNVDATDVFSSWKTIDHSQYRGKISNVGEEIAGYIKTDTGSSRHFYDGNTAKEAL